MTYRVYRTARSGAAPEVVGVTPGDTTRFTDTRVEGGHTYLYFVTATDSAGRESGPSEKISATVPAR